MPTCSGGVELQLFSTVRQAEMDKYLTCPSWLAGRAWLDSEVFCRPQCFVLAFQPLALLLQFVLAVRRFLVHLGSFGASLLQKLTLVALRAWLLAPPGLLPACRAALVYFLCELSSWVDLQLGVAPSELSGLPCHLHDAAPSACRVVWVWVPACPLEPELVLQWALA